MTIRRDLKNTRRFNIGCGMDETVGRRNSG